MPYAVLILGMFLNVKHQVSRSKTSPYPAIPCPMYCVMDEVQG
jgi:hypothetical protein